jgi:hypothetical protein
MASWQSSEIPQPDERDHGGTPGSLSGVLKGGDVESEDRYENRFSVPACAEKYL